MRGCSPLTNYEGVVEVELDDEELALFYETNQLNIELVNNQYVLIKHNNQIVDRFKYFDGNLTKVKKHNFSSKYFHKIKPRDDYQLCVMDALANNFNKNCNVTLIKGKAGSGKSLLALAYSFYTIYEKYIFDKLVVIANPLVAKNAAKLGFYPGSRTEKILDTFVGNMLISKIGDREEVNRLIHEEKKLEIIPIGDLRGYETQEKMILYIPEAQNFDINLMKLSLQRVGEGTKVIIDGDVDSQVDLDAFEGKNNGMRRVSDIFKGEKIYSEVELKNIYRSEIARIADKM